MAIVHVPYIHVYFTPFLTAFSSRNHSFVINIANKLKTFFNEQHSNSERKAEKTVGVVEYENWAELTALFYLYSNPIQTQST